MTTLARRGLAALVAVAVTATSASASAAGSTNRAIVFVKPHAVSAEACAMVKGCLEAAGCEVCEERKVTAEEIDDKGLIDQHYGTLAELAMKYHPRELTLTEEKRAAFEEAFGMAWEDAPLFTNGEAQEKLEATGAELDALWRDGTCLKLAPGTYVGRLTPEVFVVNGFYSAMREQYLAPGTCIQCYVIDFPEETLSWEQFRKKVIGATDPTQAAEGSLRARFLKDWKKLGLAEKPHIGANAVHASAGPIEGLKERMVWVGATIEEDAFGKRLLEKKEKAVIERWMSNPMVHVTSDDDDDADDEGTVDRIFDVTELMDTSDVLENAPSYHAAV